MLIYPETLAETHHLSLPASTMPADLLLRAAAAQIGLRSEKLGGMEYSGGVTR